MVAEICRRLVLCVAIRNYMCQAKVRVCVCECCWLAALLVCLQVYCVRRTVLAERRNKAYRGRRRRDAFAEADDFDA